MLNFENLNVDNKIKSMLSQFQVDFAFQPIFNRDEEIVTYEALMRPDASSIMAFIDEHQKKDMLHEIEVLTLFGATMAFKERGYDTKLSINSFPSECLTLEECNAYRNCFGPMTERLVIEILEYTEFNDFAWQTKTIQGRSYPGLLIAIDDFGSGQNGLKSIEFYNPNLVKFDRILIENINENKENQLIVKHYIESFHKKNIMLVAEGVETQAEYDFLYEAGIDFFQGFLLGRPE